MMVVYSPTTTIGQPPLLGWDDWSMIQGPLGPAMQRKYAAVLEHWLAPSGRSLDMDDPIDEDVSYNPMPPKRVHTVRVKYRAIGRGQPLPFAIDE
jgi:hypothetical protein